MNVDVTEILHAISGVLGRFAVGGELADKVVPQRNADNVEWRVGQGEKEGKALFRFVTQDRMAPEIEIDMQELWANPEAYMDGMMKDVSEGLRGARETRHDQTQIVVPTRSELSAAVRGALH